MQTNVAVGYAVCYIFGSLGPIIMVTWFLPMVMKWDIRAEAIKLASAMSGGHAELDPGQFNAVHSIDTRVFCIATDSHAIGKTTLALDAEMSDGAVVSIYRDGKRFEMTDASLIEGGDLVTVTGTIEVLEQNVAALGREVVAPEGMRLVQESRELILTNRALNGRTIGDIHDHVNAQSRHGVFLTLVKRMGLELPLSRQLELKRGDELYFTGAPLDLDRVQSKIGYKISAAAATDFVFFGVGMLAGMLVGLIQFKLWGIPISIGSGGGCLLSGLFFGWLRSVHPNFAALPMGASSFLRDFGLAVFVGIVGISAGPQALVAIQKSGLTLASARGVRDADSAGGHLLLLLFRAAHPQPDRGARVRRRRPQRQPCVRCLARQGGQCDAGRLLHRNVCRRQCVSHSLGPCDRRDRQDERGSLIITGPLHERLRLQTVRCPEPVRTQGSPDRRRDVGRNNG